MENYKLYLLSGAEDYPISSSCSCVIKLSEDSANDIALVMV
jgi:hypothetical protein